MTGLKATLTLASSLAVTLPPVSLARGQNASGVASGSNWVRPTKDNVLVYTSTGTTLESIGVLSKDAIVQVLREDWLWYQIKFTKDNAEFVGWVRKEDVAIEGTPPNPPQRNPKPEPARDPTQDQKKEPQENALSILETHEKLLKLVEVPIADSPMWKKDYNLSRLKSYRNETGNTSMQLFGGQKAKLDVLYLFDPDEVIEVFVEDKIRELKKLRKEAHPDFIYIIDCYIRALEAYTEGKFPDLRSRVEQAERIWKRIPGIVVGF